MLKQVASTIALFLLCAGLTIAGDKQVIRPKGAEPGGSWSHGILVDGTLYISGMGGEDASGTVPADFEAEVKQSLDNIGKVLELAGMTASDVVSVQVYLTDGETFERMNTVYKKYFKDPRPTRTTVVVAKLVGPGRIEITATAKK